MRVCVYAYIYVYYYTRTRCAHASRRLYTAYASIYKKEALQNCFINNHLFAYIPLMPMTMPA